MSRRATLTLVWCTGLAVAAATGWFIDAAGSSLDTEYFLRASHTLLSAGWFQTFRDPGLQAGPLEVGFIGIAGLLGRAAGTTETAGVAVLQSMFLVALVLSAATAISTGPRRALAVAAAVAGMLATATINGAYFYGHPAEVADPALWVLAACAARRGRVGAAGALVAVSAGFETWGVLGIVLLALDPRLRPRLRGLASFAVVVGVLYGPFVLFGPFRMFQYSWQVEPHTLPALLGIGPDFTWPLRLVQGAAAAIAGLVVATRLRRFGAAWWVAPLCIVWTRVALDPAWSSWYLLAPQTLAFLGASQALASRRLSALGRIAPTASAA